MLTETESPSTLLSIRAPAVLPIRELSTMSSAAVVATSFALITTLGVPSLIAPVDGEVSSESQGQPSVIEESPQVQDDDRVEDDLEELYENPDLPVITALAPQTVFGADTSSGQRKIFDLVDQRSPLSQSCSWKTSMENDGAQQLSILPEFLSTKG